MKTENPAARSEQPQTLTEDDRRALHRVELTLDASFELGKRRFAGEIHNLNTEGAFLKCATLAPPFTILRNLRFHLGAGGTVVVAESLVIWNNNNPADALYPQGMGLFFQSIEPAELDQIKDHLNKTSHY